MSSKKPKQASVAQSFNAAKGEIDFASLSPEEQEAAFAQLLKEKEDLSKTSFRLAKDNARKDKKIVRLETKIDNLEQDVKVLEQKLIEAILDGEIDELTGLYTRKKFLSDTNELLSQAKKGNPVNAFIAILDLNNFKGINDNLGHDGGDEFLKVFGKASENILGLQVYRIGGDEICLLVTDRDEARLYEEVKSLNENISFHYKDSYRVEAHFSFGLIPFNPEKTAGEMLKEVDAILYKEKRKQTKESSSFREFPPAMPIGFQTSQPG